jgi:UMF1 family MFS transporter
MEIKRAAAQAGWAPCRLGLRSSLSGSYRLAALAVGIFFVAGLILLPLVNVRRAILEAGNEPPARL